MIGAPRACWRGDYRFRASSKRAAARGSFEAQIADAVGKDRSSIANYVRLLKLPQEIRSGVGSGALSMGHARALLALPDEAAQLQISRDVTAKNLSVRETEALVKRVTEPW